MIKFTLWFSAYSQMAWPPPPFNFRIIIIIIFVIPKAAPRAHEQSLIYLLSLQIALFWTLHVHGILQQVPVAFLRFNVFKVHSCCIGGQYSVPFYGWVIPMVKSRPCFIYPLINWWAFGFFPLFDYFWLLLLWTFTYTFPRGHVFSMLLGIYLGGELLAPMLTQCLVLFNSWHFGWGHPLPWRTVLCIAGRLAESLALTEQM